MDREWFVRRRNTNSKGDEEMGKLGTWTNNEARQFEILPLENNPLEIEYTQLETRFDSEEGISWVLMNPINVPCFSLDILGELQQYNQSIEDCGGKIWKRGGLHAVRYMVFASRTPGVFNLGGQLDLFIRLIRNADLTVVTISLVQGDALGGGFEAALTSDIIIAERSRRMGFPEILFNLF